MIMKETSPKFSFMTKILLMYFYVAMSLCMYYVTYVTMSLHRSILLNFWNCWDFQEANWLARTVSNVYMLCHMETNCVEGRLIKYTTF